MVGELLPVPPAIPMLMTDERIILIVDDDPSNLAILNSVLRTQYRVRAAVSGAEAIRAAFSEPGPDLILLDVMMPEMDGYEVLARLRAEPRTRDIPVIFVTVMAEAADIERGLELGAADYVTKPVNPVVVRARVRTQLEAKQARDWLVDRKAALEAEVDRRMAENDAIQRVSIRALANLAELRDMETGNHILRTEAYVLHLATRMRRHPRFADVLTDRYIGLLGRSAPLHDIGKVGIPDQVLRNPQALNAEERAIMCTHASLGADAIERAERDIDVPPEFLSLAKEIAHWHHEHWDGTGYPDGLEGEQIPVSARLMAIADVFDALVSRRVYKPAMSYAQAREIILGGRGTHFDPDMTDGFLEGFEEFVEIAERYRDEDAAGTAETGPSQPR